MPFRKSVEEVHARRDVKAAAVRHVFALARQFPRSAVSGSNIDENALQFAILPVLDWWHGLTNEQKIILEHAKGCRSRPGGVPPYGHTSSTNFRALLAYGLDDPLEVSCFASWLQAAYLWANQVYQENSHTFPLAQYEGHAEKVNAAAEAVRLAAIA